MMSTFIALPDSQAAGFVLAAATICALSACLMVHLLQRSDAAPRARRTPWLVGAVIAAGLGVWTTHFMAMLGYRTDLVVGYDFNTTLASAGIAVVAVGLPLARATLPSDRRLRSALRAASGLGIGAMHVTGMAALEGCAQSRSLLANGLAQRQFHLVHQPILSLADDRIVSYEALIRWNHPDGGPVSPAEFIPLAEENGSIVPIGQRVLEQACREAARWPADQHLAVNVSAVQLRSPRLLSQVTDALARSGLPAHRLELELTETALVEGGRQIAHILRSLRQLGIRIAMDDFGTGYSSLAHLRDLPLDRVRRRAGLPDRPPGLRGPGTRAG